MRPTLFCAILFLLANLLNAQSVTYKPLWKVGDKRHLQISTVTKSVKNGVKEDDELDELEADVEVTREDKDNFYVTVSYENIVFRSTEKLYNKLGEEANAIKKMNLKYKVNKQTGKFELINWKEVQDFVTGSIDQMTKLLKKKSPEVASMTSLAFAPIKSAFESKQTIEAYVSEEIGYLAGPFNKKLAVGDTIKETERVPNPFSKGDSLNGTQLTYLIKTDAAKGTCEIGGKQIMDLGAFKAMMKEMMINMAKSFGVDTMDNAKLAELDNMTFDMDMSDLLTFNYNTTWPVKYVKIAVVKVADGDKESRSVVTKTVSFREIK